MQIKDPAALAFVCSQLLPLALVIFQPIRRMVAKHSSPTTSHDCSKTLMNCLNLVYSISILVQGNTQYNKTSVA